MEWLGHLIHSAISKGKWCPIRLSRSRLAISHLFFTNDLIIFSKANLEHGRVLKDILDSSYEFSRHKINFRNTNIFFSKGVDVSIVDMISTLFGFQRVHNLCHYLGVPLFHQKLTNNTLQFVVKKVRRKLKSWEAKKTLYHWSYHFSSVGSFIHS